MKRFAAACLALGILLSVPHIGYAQDPAESRQQIERVVEAFRSAIVNKDKDAFLKLLLKEDITWTSVLNDTSIEMLYASRPDPKMKRPHKIFNGSPRKFIEMIVNDKQGLEETFSNVRIDTDGEVAQVWFDYSFLADGVKKNWGKESWQMVRTGDGWKIAAVVWSQELAPPPPKAEAR